MDGPNDSRSPAEGVDTPVWLARFQPGRLWKDRTAVEW